MASQRFAFVFGLGLLLATVGQAVNADDAFMPEQVQFKPWLYTGGQPDAEQLATASEAGIETVIDLRPRDETPDFNEREVAASLGMDYRYRPVRGATDLTPESVEWLDQQLAEVEGSPTLLHCSTGNRVGALMALRARWLYDESPEQALEIGKEAGLTGLEDDVRRLLGLEAANQNAAD